MVAQSPEPGAHVLNARAFRIELEFRNVGFCGEGKTGVPGEKPLGAEKRTNNKLNPHMTSSPRIEPGPHWWKASALTTAPSLLPNCAIPAPQSHCIANISRMSLRETTYRSKWKVGKVATLFKSGVRKVWANYRPLTFLSIPSEISESVICKSLEPHVRCVLQQYQWG